MSTVSPRTLRSIAAGLFLIGGSLVSCRAQPPRFAGTSRVVTSRIAVLAEASTSEFAIDGTVGNWAAAPLDAARIAFLDQAAKRIIVLDTAGGLIAALGRQGGGPGEFGNPRFLVRTESGMAVYDDLRLSLVAFTSDGQARADLSLISTIGLHAGRLTGVAWLADGSWAYSAIEQTASTVREALYLRSNGVARLLTSTPAATWRLLRLPCGITLSGEAPVFWPTLRWAATPTHVAYAAGAQDRVVVWDVARRDSTVFEGDAVPRRATKAAALAATSGYTVETPGRGCTIEREQVLKQRGFLKRIPPIERLALSPAGVLWVLLAAPAGGSGIIRIHEEGRTDSLVPGAFPGFFLTETRFVAQEADSGGKTVVSLWEVQRR